MRIAAALLTLATVGATLTAGSLPALAQDRRVAVEYNDLNLSAPAGRETLDARIRGAARRVCGAVPTMPLEENMQVQNCRKAAMAEAWGQITATANSGQIRGTR